MHMGMKPSGVKLLTPHTKTPRREGVRKCLKEALKSCSREDLFLFYFSGHGYISKDEHYLVTQDFRVDDVRNTAISARDLHKWISASKCKRVLFILDCCYAEKFQEALYRHSKGTGSPLGRHVYLLASSELNEPSVSDECWLEHGYLTFLAKHYFNFNCSVEQQVSVRKLTRFIRRYAVPLSRFTYTVYDGQVLQRPVLAHLIPEGGVETDASGYAPDPDLMEYWKGKLRKTRTFQDWWSDRLTDVQVVLGTNLFAYSRIYYVVLLNSLHSLCILLCERDMIHSEIEQPANYAAFSDALLELVLGDIDQRSGDEHELFIQGVANPHKVIDSGISEGIRSVSEPSAPPGCEIPETYELGTETDKMTHSERDQPTNKGDVLVHFDDDHYPRLTTTTTPLDSHVVSGSDSAILIGISSLEGVSKSFVSGATENDIHTMRDIFIDTFGMKPSSVYALSTLSQTPAKVETVKKTLSKVCKGAKRGSAIFLYISAPCWQQGGEHFIPTQEYQRRGASSFGITSDLLEKYLGKSDASRVFLFLDCDNAGKFAGPLCARLQKRVCVVAAHGSVGRGLQDERILKHGYLTFFLKFYLRRLRVSSLSMDNLMEFLSQYTTPLSKFHYDVKLKQVVQKPTLLVSQDVGEVEADGTNPLSGRLADAIVEVVSAWVDSLAHPDHDRWTSYDGLETIDRDFVLKGLKEGAGMRALLDVHTLPLVLPCHFIVFPVILSDLYTNLSEGGRLSRHKLTAVHGLINRANCLNAQCIYIYIFEPARFILI
eukprot:sb/3462309/